MRLAMAPLFSGSSGNSTYIGTERTSILIDAGLPGSSICCAMQSIAADICSVKGILITHEHSDHIKGVGVLSRKYDIPVYANCATWEQIYDKLGRLAEKNIRVIDRGDFFIGELCITPVPLSHDAADPTGYVVSARGACAAVMTDSGKVTGKMIELAGCADTVLLESNHDVDMLKRGSYPYQLKQRILSAHGHLSNADSARAAEELIKRGVRTVILGHLSRENNVPALAYQTVCDALCDHGIHAGSDVRLTVAKPAEVTGVFETV